MKKHIPWFPLSALIFFLSIWLLITLHIIPSPLLIIERLITLYEQIGWPAMFISSFIEATPYLGLYIPGSMVPLVAIIACDGSFLDLFLISFVVTMAITLASIINYFLGRLYPRLARKQNTSKKGLLFSMLHPNSLAFYMLYAGATRKSRKILLLVPLIILPYGLLVSFCLWCVRNYLKFVMESPLIICIALFIWVILAFLMQKNT